ncbi:hypothetical protein GCM10010470_44840 [Saccharopolyspora taberi]|uniref:Transposase n=1 Tax=Saccharopolyspora taberi TaxID=60895 RepID=A0ABN3VIS5_9PSEU
MLTAGQSGDAPRITTTIPQAADRVRNRLTKAHRDGRPPAFDRDAYRGRNMVERCINIRLTTEQPDTH